MAIIRPFAALRPDPRLARDICELPYDVLSSAEARVVASSNPLSFLHVSKPEIDFPPQIDPHDEQVYAKGRANFRRLIEQGSLRRDAEPRFYLYRQVMGTHRQLGLAAVVSCEDYLSDVVRKHELTRPDKEDDRVRHIESLDAQTGPAFLTYPAQARLNELFAGVADSAPDIDFVAADGVRHSTWPIVEPATSERILASFAEMPRLYIADGHHRSAAASRVYKTRKGRAASGFFLSVLFPHDQLQILPYNRVMKDLNGRTPAQVLEQLAKVFRVEQPGPALPARKHEVCLYLEKRWHRMNFLPGCVAGNDPVEQLDVSLLQNLVLAPLFGIENPRTSERVSFVGGIRGTVELQKLVDSGEFACAFSMFPTDIKDLMSIADLGGLMPPKSTWFEPKLRDGMFCHLLE